LPISCSQSSGGASYLPLIQLHAFPAQVLGPRYTFLRAKGLHESLLPQTKSQAPLASNLPPHDAENTSASLLLLTALVTQTDVDWCQGMGVGLNEFREHSAHFQTDYNEQVSKVRQRAAWII